MSKHFALFLLPAWACAARVRKDLGAGRDWVFTPAGSKASAGSKYAWHGTFRDLSVWHARGSEVEDDLDRKLWVVEYETSEMEANEIARAESLNLTVVFKEGKSVVYQGDVLTTLGEGSCGSKQDKTVIPVPPHEVEIKPMAQAEVEKYAAMAQRKDRNIEKVLKLISRDNLKANNVHLTSWPTRHSFSGVAGLDPAADWSAEELRRMGYRVWRDDFRPGGKGTRPITPQVVAELPGTQSRRVVIIGAHLDSITFKAPNDPLYNAPGADDNGSGCAALLELARMIKESGLRFKHSIRLVLFNGEEQGLLGSRSLAKDWKDAGVNMIAMFNMDMVGYRIPGTPISVNVMTRGVDQDLTNMVKATAVTYFGDKVVIGEQGACCSDQMAFWQQGVPAATVFETAGAWVAYPELHTRLDLVNPQNIDFEQMEYQAGTVLAAALTFAEVIN